MGEKKKLLVFCDGWVCLFVGGHPRHLSIVLTAGCFLGFRGVCLSFRCCFWVASTFSLDGWLALLKSVGSSQVTALLCPAHVGVKSSIQHLIIVIDHRGKAVGKEVDYQDSPG